jgi:hypothetical protein
MFFIQKKIILLQLLLISFAVAAGFSADKEKINCIEYNIYITADFNELAIENLLIFKRQSLSENWNIRIELPGGNDFIERQLDPNSLIDSVSFNYSIVNQNGNADFTIPVNYNTERVNIYISGTATRLISDGQVKLDKFKTEKSRFSNVYTVFDASEGIELSLKIINLPHRPAEWVNKICFVVLGLIIISTVSMIYFLKK